jgi:hypothetical protein
MARPFNPVEDYLEEDEGLEISYAVWNLLNNQGEEDMPLLLTADWLKFVVGRSGTDQVELTHVMAKILLRARWANACCQKMFSGWKVSHRRRREMERALDAMGIVTECSYPNLGSNPASSKWRCARMWKP